MAEESACPSSQGEAFPLAVHEASGAERFAKAVRLFSELRNIDVSQVHTQLHKWSLHPHRVAKSRVAWHQWVGCLVVAAEIFGARELKPALVAAKQMYRPKQLWMPNAHQASGLVKGEFPPAWQSRVCRKGWAEVYRPAQGGEPVGGELADLAGLATGELKRFKGDNCPHCGRKTTYTRSTKSQDYWCDLCGAVFSPAETHDKEPSEATKASSDNMELAPEIEIVAPGFFINRMTVDQLELRRTGITATEISVINGTNPWKTTLDVWVDKVDDQPPQLRSLGSAAEWGIILEPVVLYAYVQDHPGEIKRYPTLRHPEREFMLATPDAGHVPAEPGPERLVEVKTTGKYWEDVPAWYVDQVHWQWGVLQGLGHELHPVVHIPCLSSYHGFEMVVWEVEIDKAHLSHLIEIGQVWWETHVVAGEPPAIDSPTMALQQLYPRHKGRNFLEASPQAEDLLAILPEWLLRQDLCEKAIGKIYALLQEEIGDAPGLRFANGHRISWKNNKDSKRTDWKAAFGEIFNSGQVDQEYLQAVLSRHTVEKSGVRVFRPNAKKLL